MASKNLVIIIGNITRDPELKYTAKGVAIADISIACNRKYKTSDGETREEVTYLEVKFWGKQAEVIGEHLRKGALFYAEGRLTVEQWEDKDTGKKRQKLIITGEQFQFLGKSQNGNSREGIVRELDPPRRDDAPQQQASAKPSYEEDFDSIPF